MRKAACWFLLVLTLCLAGCGPAQANPATVQLAFTARAEITCGGVTFRCKLERKAPGMVTYALEDGPTYLWDGEGFSTSYAGLVAASGECPLPEKNFAVQMNRYLDACAKENALTPQSQTELSGSLEGVAYTVTVDTEGRIQALSCTQSDLHASFSYDEPSFALLTEN